MACRRVGKRVKVVFLQECIKRCMERIAQGPDRVSGHKQGALVRLPDAMAQTRLK